MTGFITRTEVIENARLIAELYGLEVLLHCLSAQAGDTFLGIVAEHERRTHQHHEGQRMFTVTWHYDDGGLGSFREATFDSYGSALRAFQNTTQNVSPLSPALVSAMLTGASGYVFGFFAAIADGQLVEK